MRLLLAKKAMQTPSALTILSTSLLLALISNHTLAATHTVSAATIGALNTAIAAANADTASTITIDFGDFTPLDLGSTMIALTKNTILTADSNIELTGTFNINAELTFAVGSAAFTFTGGEGIAGRAASPGTAGRAAGAGGAGVTGSGFTLTNTNDITGGVGGRSRNVVAAGGGGAGVTGSDFTLTNSSNITGGKGGYSIDAGVAGTGGAGVSGSGFTLTNSSNITGGRGGKAFNIGPTSPGAGGAGVTGSGFTLTNSSNIYAGAGGDGDGRGAGAVGVAINSTGNSKVYNSGNIVSTSGTAIAFSSGGNLLVLKTGSNITGHVISSAAGDTLFSEASSTITGNVSGFSTFKTAVTDDTNYSKLNIIGTLTLLSNTDIIVDVANPVFDFSSSVNSGLDDIISASTITESAGGSAFTVTDNSFIFNFDAILDTNTIDLTLKADTSKVSTSVLSSNKKAAAGAALVLDSVIANNPSGKFAAHFVSLSTAEEVANAVESTLPAVAGGASIASSLTSKAVTRLVSARQKNISGLSSGDMTLKNQHFWLQTFGSRAEQDTQQGVQGYDVDSYGLVIGIDGEYSPTWQVGAAFSYANSDVSSRLSAGKNVVSIDSYQANVYASKQLDEQTLWSIQSSVGQLKYDSSRLLFNNDIAKSEYDGWQFQLHSDLARHIQLSEKTAITPYIGASYRYIDVNGYRESGAGALNLIVKDDSFDSLVVSAGVRHQYSATNHLSLITELGLGYDLMADQSNLTSSYAGGGAQFTTEGIKPAALTYDAAIGVQYKLENGTNINAKYSVNGREHFKQGTFKLNARWMF